ncbi:MAG: DUF2147 domain-containing protein [Bacteroidales bacterium]|nr:DUF2147 domain-containing protein [Bacteroidales bacterium]MDD3431187.1 DUF2147 domain-containing protein [Bacteroidales bacterium]
MKKIVSLFSCLFMLSLLAGSAQAQNKADKILGFYTTYNDDTGEESSQVQIFKAADGKYYGKIVWLKEPNENGKPKVDDQNPDKALQNKPLIGLELLKAFTYDPKSQEWVDGSIYDPDNGKTYNCFMKFDGDTKLNIRGFIGKAWMGLGRTTSWTVSEQKQ